MPRRAHLRRLLEDFVPKDAAEHAHKAGILQLIETTEQPMSRQQYTPGHVTASAFVTSEDGRDLLLIHHSKLGRWLQPGGHIEPEDVDVLASARREVLEETGLATLALARPGLFDVDVHDIPGRAEQPAHQHFDVRFWFSSPTRELRAASDALNARWVALETLFGPRAHAVVDSDESVLRAVRKLAEAR